MHMRGVVELYRIDKAKLLGETKMIDEFIGALVDDDKKATLVDRYDALRKTAFNEGSSFELLDGDEEEVVDDASDE